MKRGLCILTLAVGACAGDADRSSVALTAAVDTVDGAERLSYPADAGAALGWTVDTAAVIGDVFGDDVYQFGQVPEDGLAGDADGNLYVLDRQAHRVLKYAPDGRHLATFGKQGGGPGELEQPIDLTLGPGDSLWIADFSNARTTIIPQGGGDPRSIRFPENTFPMYGMAVHDDCYVQALRMMRFDMGRGAGRSGPSADPGVPLVRFAMDGTATDTLWTAPPPQVDRVELESAGRVMVMVSARSFAPALDFDRFSDGTLAVNDTAEYLIVHVSPDGGIERWIQRAPPPRPTTDADREAERERVRAEEQGGGGGVAIRRGGGGGDAPDRNPLLQQRLEKMTFAEVIPRIVELAVDPRDRLWVGVSEETPGEVERIDLYDRDGAFLGELRGIPFPDVFMGPDRYGVLAEDELDVQQVVVYRLREGGLAGSD